MKVPKKPFFENLVKNDKVNSLIVKLQSQSERVEYVVIPCSIFLNPSYRIDYLLI